MVQRAVDIMVMSGMSLVPDGSGLGSPGTALQSFWKYTMCLQMSGNVYVLRRGTRIEDAQSMRSAVAGRGETCTISAI